MKTLKRILAVLTAVTFSTSYLRAEEKKTPSDLVGLMPPTSGVVLNCEVARTLNEPVTLKLVEEFFKRADIKQGIESFAQMTGLDIRKNITRFCLSGDIGVQGIRIIAIEGTFNIEHLKNTLGQFTPPPSAYRDYSIFTLPDDKGGPPNFLAIPNSSLLLFGKEEPVRQALDLFDGTSPVAEGMLTALQKMDLTSLVRVGFQQVDKIKGDPNPIQPHLRSLTGNIVAAKDGVTVAVNGSCDTADAATDLTKIAVGFLSLAKLQADFERKPDVKMLLKTVAPTLVTSNGSDLHAALNVSQPSLDDLYRRAIDKKDRGPVGGRAEQAPGTE